MLVYPKVKKRKNQKENKNILKAATDLNTGIGPLKNIDIKEFP